MTLTLEYLAPVAAAPLPATAAPAAAIPNQHSTPTVVVSLTEGCDGPLDALKLVPLGHEISCHPCDEAIVRLLMARIRRADALLVSTSVSPGTLCLG